MNPAEIADKVNEGMESLAPTFFVSETGAKTIDDLQREIVSTIEEVAGDPDEYSMWTVATNLISKVRAYLIVDAELPENPYEQVDGYRADIAYDDGDTDIVAEAAHYRAFSEGQQSMLAAGWRKVKEARE